MSEQAREKNVQLLKFHLNDEGDRPQFDSSVHVLGSALETTTIGTDPDGRQVETIFLTYDTQTGELMPPQYDAEEGAFSLAILKFDYGAKRVLVDAPNFEWMVQSIAAGLGDLDDCVQVVPVSDQPMRLVQYTKETVDEALPSGKRLGSMGGNAETFGAQPGDRVLLASIVDYNVEQLNK